MDSEDFLVTMDSREDATLEELSGEHGESREVVEAGETVIPVTDGAITKAPLFRRNSLTGSGNPSFESCVEVKAQQR